MNECLFCRIAAREIDAEIVSETEEWVAFRDIEPQAPTHILIVPRNHVATANDLAAEDDDIMGRLVRGAAQIAVSEGIAEDGYRLVLNTNPGAGQSVFHLHVHLLGGRPMGWPPG